MAELTTIARPYAKATFQFALENNALEKWSNTLVQLALIASDKTVKALLSQPQLTGENKAEIFSKVCEQPLDEFAKNLLLQLAGNKRLATLPAIYVLFEALLAEQQKTVDVNVKSAFPLNDAEAEKLLASLKVRLGREVKMESEVDKSLIGGVIIHAGDLVIDASVKGKLAKLTNELNT
jgi:F-type H+-transporting ATPase subunit delta